MTTWVTSIGAERFGVLARTAPTTADHTGTTVPAAGMGVAPTQTYAREFRIEGPPA